MSALLADTTFVGLPAGAWATALAAAALVWVAYPHIRQAAREHAEQSRQAHAAQADQLKMASAKVGQLKVDFDPAGGGLGKGWAWGSVVSSASLFHCRGARKCPQDGGLTSAIG